MGYAGGHRVFTYLSWVLSAVSALVALIPFLYIWRILRDVLAAAPDYAQAVNIPHYGWMAVLFAAASYLIYVGALLCSHLSAFRVATNLRLAVTEHLAALPLGFTERFGSGQLRKIIQESTGAAETYLAHQLPDQAGAMATPVGLLGLLIALLGHVILRLLVALLRCVVLGLLGLLGIGILIGLMRLLGIAALLIGITLIGVVLVGIVLIRGCLDRNALIRSFAESQQGDEDVGQENQSRRKAAALAECPGQPNLCLDAQNDVVDGDQQQQEAHTTAPGDIKQHIEIVEGNNGRPAGLTGLPEDNPHAHQNKHAQDKRDNGGRRVKGRGTAVIVIIGIIVHCVLLS